MTGISTTGLGLPTPQTLFTGGATPTAPASTVPVNGPTVTGPGGTTALPSASPADFQGVNPTPLDQPHPTYPTLTQSHVAVLQAIGTPESVIAQLAATQPAAEYLDRYIQGEIMQNPEGWDAYVGNPTGTARAGLTQLVPNIQLPAPGAGTPGQLPDGSRVDGINVPGVTQPLVSPQANAGEGIVKGIVIAAAVVGVGLLAWKFMKGRNAAKDAANLLNVGPTHGMPGAGGPNALQAAIEAAAGGGAAGGGGWFNGLKADSIDTQRRLLMHAVAGPGAGSGGALTAATLDGVARNMGVLDGAGAVIGNTQIAYNMPLKIAADIHFKSRALDIAELAVKMGQGPEWLAATTLMANYGQAAAGGAAKATQLAGLQQAFAGIANAMA